MVVEKKTTKEKHFGWKKDEKDKNLLETKKVQVFYKVNVLGMTKD